MAETKADRAREREANERRRSGLIPKLEPGEENESDLDSARKFLQEEGKRRGVTLDIPIGECVMLCNMSLPCFTKRGTWRRRRNTGLKGNQFA